MYNSRRRKILTSLEVLIIYIACLIGSNWHIYKKGKRWGIQYATDYMEKEGLVEFDDTTSKEIQ